MAQQKVIEQGRNVYDVLAMLVIHAQWLYTLRYNIKGSVATSRAMPTPCFFSWHPEALCGLMTKHLSCIHNTVVLLLHSSSIH